MNKGLALKQIIKVPIFVQIIKELVSMNIEAVRALTVDYPVLLRVCDLASSSLSACMHNFRWLYQTVGFFQLPELIVTFVVSGAISGIPLGWFLFQVYDTFLHDFFACML